MIERRKTLYDYNLKNNTDIEIRKIFYPTKAG